MSMLDHVPEQRILKGAPATLTTTLYDADGEVDQSIDSGVTVTITRLDGTAIATAQATTTASNGVVTYTLTAAQTGSTLDVLTAAWTHNSVVRATTYHEIVGAHYFPPSRLLKVPGISKALTTGPGDQTSTALIAARTWIETLIEWATGVAWVPRTALDYLDSPGGPSLLLRHVKPRVLTSVTIDDVAETASDYVLDEIGAIRLTEGGNLKASKPREFVVRYSHGFDSPPRDLVEAAVVAAADRLFTDRTSLISSRATSYTDGAGTVTNLAALNPDNPTGIREVDRAIRSYNHRRPGIA